MLETSYSLLVYQKTVNGERKVRLLFASTEKNKPREQNKLISVAGWVCYAVHHSVGVQMFRRNDGVRNHHHT